MFFATDSWQLYPSTLALYFLFGSFERSLSNLSHLDNSTIVLFLPFFFKILTEQNFPLVFSFYFVFCFSFPTLENCLFAFMFIFRALALYDCSFVWWKKVKKKRQKQHTWSSTILTSRAVLMESMSNYDYVSYLCRWEGEWRRKKNVNPNFVFRVKDMTCDLKHVGTKTTAAEFVFFFF